MNSTSEEGQLDRYDCFIRREMRRRVRSRIEDAVSRELAPLEQDLLQRLPDLISEIQREISRDYQTTLRPSFSSEDKLASLEVPNPSIPERNYTHQIITDTAADLMEPGPFDVAGFGTEFSIPPEQFTFMDQGESYNFETLENPFLDEGRCLFCDLEGNVKGKYICPHAQSTGEGAGRGGC